MENVMNPGTVTLMPLVISAIMVILGLVLWFFVNRASVKANQQIALLNTLVEQQKRQIVLLRRLCDANEQAEVSHEDSGSGAAPQVAAQENNDDLISLVAER